MIEGNTDLLLYAVSCLCMFASGFLFGGAAIWMRLANKIRAVEEIHEAVTEMRTEALQDLNEARQMLRDARERIREM